MTHEVHTGGNEFRLDIIDDDAPVNQKRWRIVLKDEVFQVVLFDDAGNEYRGLQIERRGITPEVYKNRDVIL